MLSRGALATSDAAVGYTAFTKLSASIRQYSNVLQLFTAVKLLTQH
jgi:hypothetical protein